MQILNYCTTLLLLLQRQWAIPEMIQTAGIKDIKFLGVLSSDIYLKTELMKWADFLHADTNLWKLNVNLIIIDMLKNGQDFIKSGAPKWKTPI